MDVRPMTKLYNTGGDPLTQLKKNKKKLNLIDIVIKWTKKDFGGDPLTQLSLK